MSDDKPLCECGHEWHSHSYDWGCDAQDRIEPIRRYALAQGPPLCDCFGFKPDHRV